MKPQPDGTFVSAKSPSTPPADSAASWTRSVQLVSTILLCTCLLALVFRSWQQSLQAGTGTIPALRIELNSATTAQLMLVPGVGHALAERILNWRETKGPFRTVEELRKVPGVGPAKLESLKQWVFLGADAPPDPPHAGHPLQVQPSKPPAAKPKKGEDLDGPIDINHATADQLMRIPGIGPVLSKRIVDERARRPFASVAELRRVSGIGPKTLEKVRPFVTTSDLRLAGGL